MYRVIYDVRKKFTNYKFILSYQMTLLYFMRENHVSHNYISKLFIHAYIYVYSLCHRTSCDLHFSNTIRQQQQYVNHLDRSSNKFLVFHVLLIFC